MLERNKTSDNEINKWLSIISSSLEIPVRRVSANHWQLDMKNPVGQYTVDIYDQGEWITFGVPLVPDVEGHGQGNFYGTLLDLSARLNGVHIGREDNRIVLISEVQKEELNPIELGRIILLTDQAHRIVYPELLNEMKRLDLKFSSS